MGKERVLRTYGHHRQRCVVTTEAANVFECNSGKKQHVFSTSGSESGLGPSDSLDSVDAPGRGVGRGRRAKNKSLLELTQDEDENYKKGKRKRQPRKAVGTLFSSDKDIFSSSDCATPAAKRVTRRALSNISNDMEKKPKAKRRPAKRKQNDTTNKSSINPPPQSHGSINFSEFDDYSLVIVTEASASSVGVDRSRKNKKLGHNSQTVAGTTSTPCRSEKTCAEPCADLHAADISCISAFNESVMGGADSGGESPLYSLATPPSLFSCTRSPPSASSDPTSQSECAEEEENCEDSDRKNLERLEESMASLRVGGRRLRKRAMPAEQKTSQRSETSVDLSPVLLKNGGLEEEDPVVMECKIRVQKLKKSLLRSTVGSGDRSGSEEFDASASLFDLSEQRDLRSSSLRTLSQCADQNVGASVEDRGWSSESDGELDSGSPGSGDLSAIVEDGEEEEDTEEDVDAEESQSRLSVSDSDDENVSSDEVNGSYIPEDISTMDDSCVKHVDSVLADVSIVEASVIEAGSLIEGSPVRYMLNSLNGVEEEASVVISSDDEAEDSSSRKSEDVGSFIESSTVCYTLNLSNCANGEAGDEDVDDVLSEGEANCSILNFSGRKSQGAHLTRSFAEVLTPSKNKAEELSPRDSVLQQCGQTEPLPFAAVLPASVIKKCVKVGEGVYGEVFRTQNRGHSVALKIIPIEGDFEVNDEPQKTFQEILPEIVISNELSQLREGEENNTPNFCPVKSVSLVKGSYPAELLKQWDIFAKKKKSENDRPDMFGEDQLYIMFEFGDGGRDLDGTKLVSAAQAVSILQQVACALAVAEQVLAFEHRDLHMGNVLVQPTCHATVTLTLNASPVTIHTHGLHVSIIDFTLSRLTKDGCTVFCDLSTDDTLFEGKGDYQFDIYRMMKKENNNLWEQYHPHSNVLWLHYLCDKLIHHRHFQDTDRTHRDFLKQLRQAYNDLLNYSCAAHFVLDDPLFKE